MLAKKWLSNVFAESPSPIIIISKIFGISGYRDGLKNHMNVVYCTALCVIYCLCFYLSYNTVPNDDYPAICVVGQLIHNTLGMFICALGYLLSLRLCQTGENNFVTDKLQHVDQTMFAVTKTKVVHSETSRKFQWTGVLICCVAFIMMILCDSLIFSGVYYERTFITCFIYTYPFVFGTIIQGQFISAVHQIYLRFKFINRSFVHISNVNDNTSKVVNVFTKISSPVSIKKATVKKINDKEINIIFEDALRKNNNAEPLATANDIYQMPLNMHMNLHTIFEQHDDLLDISERLNDMYSIHIVTFVSVAFVIILFGFFFETKVIFWLWGQNSRLILVALSYFLWSALMLATVYALLSICTYTRDEAYNSAMIVHKILQKKPMFILNDEVYYNKLKSFTLKILHRKNSFKFHGLGLFILDFTFIFSAVSAATSYLIVLLQFDLSADLN